MEHNNKNINLEINDIDPDNEKSFTYYFKGDDINAKYYLKIKIKNPIYLECGKKHNGCNDKIKFDKKLKNLY